MALGVKYTLGILGLVGTTAAVYGVTRRKKRGEKETAEKTVAVVAGKGFFSNYLSESEMEDLLSDSNLYELAEKLHPFAKFDREAFTDILRACADTAGFERRLKMETLAYTLGTARSLRRVMHPIIEGLRQLRAAVERETKNRSLLQTFDDIAGDIQQDTNDKHENIYLQSQYATETRAIPQRRY
jgi:hypothetical protein